MSLLLNMVLVLVLTPTGLAQGTLDILVQRTGRQGQGTITFVQNNVFHDAFFLKAIGAYFNIALCSLTRSFAVLNGACNGYCTPRNANESSYHVRVSIPTIP